MRAITGPFIRSFAFVRKEVVEVVRQPRLVATLILGPFLILLLFGLGYQADMPELRTLFVGDPQDPLVVEVESSVEDLGGGAIDYAGVVEDRDQALGRLGEDIDLVVVLPDDPLATIRSGERALVEAVHRQLDPFEEATIALMARTTIDRVNRRLLEEVVTEAQERSDGVVEGLDAATASATALRSAVETGDTVEVDRHRTALDEALAAVESTGAITAMLNENLADGSSFAAAVDDVRERTVAVAADDAPADAALAEAEDIERRIAELRSLAVDLRAIDAGVLISPFEVDAGVVGAVDFDLTDFYAPAVIALLLQHLAITFAALSLVRERALGTTEVFGVAPLRVGETLVGKFVGYAVICGAVTALLSAVMLAGFGVPLAGSVETYAAVLALTACASLGIGFVISALVTSDIQAVNVAMIMLLLALFFSGFFIDLSRLAPEVQVVSRLLPTTYAIEALRTVMFTGGDVPDQTWAALGAGSVGMLFLAWVLMRWRLRTT